MEAYRAAGAEARAACPNDTCPSRRHSFLVAWAAALQGHMMWMQRQEAFKHKFGADASDASSSLDSSST